MDFTTTKKKIQEKYGVDPVNYLKNESGENTTERLMEYYEEINVKHKLDSEMVQVSRFHLSEIPRRWLDL